MKHHSTLVSDLPNSPCTAPQRWHGPAVEADGAREVFEQRMVLNPVPDPADAVKKRLAAPLERWSRPELCDLLAGFVAPDIDERLYAKMTGGRDVDMAFEAAVIWAWFSVCADGARYAGSNAPAKI